MMHPTRMKLTSDTGALVRASRLARVFACGRLPRAVACAAVIATAVAACGKGGYSEELTSGYVLQGGEDKTGVTLVYTDGDQRVQLVEQPVLAYINNEQYLAVIREASPSADGDSATGEKWEYYVIPLADKISEVPAENLFGPLGRDAFVALLAERKLPTAIQFAFLDV